MLWQQKIYIISWTDFKSCTRVLYSLTNQTLSIPQSLLWNKDNLACKTILDSWYIQNHNYLILRPQL